MSQRINNEVIYQNSTPIEVWKYVCDGTLKRFYAYFWDKENFKKIIRYIVFNNIEEEGVKDFLCKVNLRKFCYDNKISGGYKCFKRKPYEAIKYCFPEHDIKPWELKCVCDNYFKDEINVREAILWALEKKGVNNNRKRICEEFGFDFLKEFGLLRLTHDWKIYQLIEIAIPKYDIKPWELKRTFSWNNDIVKEATLWMLEKEQINTREDVCNRLTTRLFEKNGLQGMLQSTGYSTIKILDIVFPGEYTVYDLKGYVSHR